MVMIECEVAWGLVRVKGVWGYGRGRVGGRGLVVFKREKSKGSSF